MRPVEFKLTEVLILNDSLINYCKINYSSYKYIYYIGIVVRKIALNQQ